MPFRIRNNRTGLYYSGKRSGFRKSGKIYTTTYHAKWRLADLEERSSRASGWRGYGVEAGDTFTVEECRIEVV